MLAAQIGDGNAGLMLLQDSDDLLFRKAASLHALVLVLGQNELQTGLSPRGKVTLEEGLRAVNDRIAELEREHHHGHAMEVLKQNALDLARQIDELRSVLVEQAKKCKAEAASLCVR